MASIKRFFGFKKKELRINVIKLKSKSLLGFRFDDKDIKIEVGDTLEVVHASLSKTLGWVYYSWQLNVDDKMIKEIEERNEEEYISVFLFEKLKGQISKEDEYRMKMDDISEIDRITLIKQPKKQR